MSAVSLWLDGMDLAPRAPLPGDRDADIAIVGAGFTGLWTALYLKRADPLLRIVVLERDFAGFGASGRNGGWCSDLFPVSDAALARGHGRAAALAMRSAIRASIAEVGQRAAEVAPDARFVRGGTLSLARTAAQVARGRWAVAEAAHWDADLRWLEAAELSQICCATGVLGATFTPHCAALDPGALVRGLAEAVVRAGVDLYEGTSVQAIEPGRARTSHGVVLADVVVRATEAYSAGLPSSHRAVAPVYSLITATEPLSASQLANIGLADRPTFTDYRNLVIYGQRTADGRLVFGGRGAPYHFGSRILPSYDNEPSVFEALQMTLRDLFPSLDGVQFTHSWGGPLGVARDWHPSVGWDRATGSAWAGGYVGDGVAASNLAGRTLADLILGNDSELVRLPWVGHRSPNWEIEPLRWLGINAGLQVTRAADRIEARTGRPSRLASLLGRLTGH